jgi:iron complex transport system substrate-binding protein
MEASTPNECFSKISSIPLSRDRGFLLSTAQIQYFRFGEGTFMLRKLTMPFMLAFMLVMTACVPALTSMPVATILPAIQQNAASQTLTDALGRSVKIAAKPMRIVSLAPSVTEILFAIGAGPQVVGRTRFCNYPAEAASRPTIGGFSAKPISVEAILDLQPDLVVAGSKSQKDVVAALEAQGVTVFTLAPESLTDIEAGIQTLGEITGNAASAQTVVTEMQSRIVAVTAKVNNIPAGKRLRVFYEVWHEPLTTTSHSTFIGELLTLAGAVNIFNDLAGTYPEVSAEQIIDSDPQVILGPSNHSDQLSAAVLSARPGWEKLVAVRNGAIHIVDADMISRAGPRVVDALESIAKALYPELFKN